MKRVSRIVLAIIGLIGAGWCVGPANANGGVQDPAKLFTPGAVRRAEDQIQRLKRDHKKEIFVETLENLPSPEKGGPDQSNKQATSKWVSEFALGRAKAQSVNGVYFLLIKNPGKFQFEIGNKTLQKEFTLSDRDEAIQKIIPLLKENRMDDVLETLVGFVSGKMAQAHPVAAKAVAPGRQNNNVVAENKEANPLLGYLCIGALVLGAIMLVMGLMRGLMGGGGGMAGGPGMSPGYGGGGFLSNMLGGMFGAAAGMWMYDSFFGHGGSRAWGSGGEGQPYNGGEMDSSSGQDTDYSGSGGDWGGGGDNSGGGDWGGGGGDWGGGGGDFGGGGGDY